MIEENLILKSIKDANELAFGKVRFEVFAD